MQAKGIKNQESVVDISKTGIQKSELRFINALKGAASAVPFKAGKNAGFSP
jgi:hypothetical protein